MFVRHLKSQVLSICAVMFAACLTSSAAAQSTTLFYEDFTDATLATNGNLNGADPNSAVIDNGTAKITDVSITARASFSVAQTFSAEVMTFQVDFTSAIVPTDPARMEVIFRAGVGAGNNTLASIDTVIESIVYRGLSTDATPSRLPLNNGKETLFMIYNHKATSTVFTSPVDGTEVTLNAYQYVPYVFDRDAMTYAALRQKGISLATGATADGVTAPAQILRFGIGSSTNADAGTLSIDNVLVRSGVFFDRTFPAVSTPGDFDGMNGVNAADLALWTQRFGNVAAPLADADNDGDTDGADFLIWQQNTVTAPAVAAGAAVPEPKTAMVATVGLLATLGAARRRTSRAA
jgi:hypothetical protein